MDKNPFKADFFEVVSGKEARTDIVTGDPCVILATSGMLTGGPAVEYFKQLAGDPRNMLILVSYQVKGSLGRKLQRGWRKIQLINSEGRTEIINVEMEVHTVRGFSGHSDRLQLLSFAGKVTPRPSRIVICHGEESKCLDLGLSLKKLLQIEALVPQNLEAIRVR